MIIPTWERPEGEPFFFFFFLHGGKDLAVVGLQCATEELMQTTYRRTGITLAEGKRDEHGMEEIDGMFSSPEKSPTKENGFGEGGDETSMGSDGMSLDEGRHYLFK